MKLCQILNPALDSVSIDLIKSFFRKARDYERAYLEGLKAGKEVEEQNFFRSYMILSTFNHPDFVV